jgi:hypothetical protein
MERLGWNRIFLFAIVLATALSVGNASAREAVHPGTTTMKAMADDDLRTVFASGFADFLSARRSLYYADGNAVEVLGDSGLLLNLPTGLPGGDPFTNIILNPANMSTLVDRDGNALVRLSAYIDEADYPDIHLNSGRGFGSIVIRGIDLRGTIIRISHTQ